MVRYSHVGGIIARIFGIVLLVVGIFFFWLFVLLIDEDDSEYLGELALILIAFGIALCILAHRFNRFKIVAANGVLSITPRSGSKRQLGVGQISSVKPTIWGQAEGLSLFDNMGNMVVNVTTQAKGYPEFLSYLQQARPDLFAAVAQPARPWRSQQTKFPSNGPILS
jgi:hypothetical protein